LDSQIKKINNLKNHHQKLFILVGGGSASGKNYFANSLNFPLLDVDQINEKLNNGKVDCRNTISKALSIVKKKLQENFENGISFIQVSTAAGYPGTCNKFKLAKEHRFTTVFVNIDVPIKTALINNEHRVLNGGHGFTIPKWKIIASNISSKTVFNQLRKTEWVDYSFKIRNKGVNIGRF